MRLAVDQGKLLAALSLAQTISNRRGNMPAYTNVRLSAAAGKLRCASSDGMIAGEQDIEAEVKDEGALCMGVKHILAVVRTLPEGRVELTGADNHWLHLRAGPGLFKLMGVAASDFPSLPEPRAGKKLLEFYRVPSHVFADLLQKTVFSVSSDEARVNLNGALWEQDGDEATMVSTDGHRLTCYKRPVKGMVLEKPVVIPRKGMVELCRVLDKQGGDIGIACGATHLFVQTDDTLMSVKLNAVAFPPYRAVVPGQHSRAFEVRTADLLTSLRQAEVLAPEKTATVKMELTEGVLVLTADNPELGVSRLELAVEYDGTPLVTGFNARYLIEALEAIDTEKARLEFQGELDPCVVRPVDGPAFLGVVMPMRV